MKRFFALGSALFLIPAGGCGPTTPVAYGEPNSLIVVAADSLWAAIGDTLESAVAPRIRTVRAERTFNLTHIAPRAPEWQELRKWKQILAIGVASDPWMAEVLDGRAPQETPALLEATNVWARGDQRVFALVVPEENPAASVIRALPALHERLDVRFREYVLARMFTSGQNRGLESRLRDEAGFSLLVPRVYDYERIDSVPVHVFRNLLRGDTDLIRSIAVVSRPAAGSLEAEAVLDWRDRVVSQFDNLEQQTEREDYTATRLESGALEIRGSWLREPGGWPAAGPFIARAVRCPAQDRDYLIDAWLFAPGRDKYEYLLQLETILNSFECAGASGARS